MISKDELQTIGYRLLCVIIRIPHSSFTDSSSIFTARAMDCIMDSPNSTTELCQAALKFLADSLKHCPSFDLDEKSSAYLLNRIGAEIHEPDRQGVMFSLIRSFFVRKKMLKEVYDIVDILATMLVTNQVTGVREVARSLYIQFLFNYPHGKGRLQKQLLFLIKNLSFDHIAGRQSVLETLNIILLKFNDDVVQEVIQSLYVPLVMMLINDDEE